MGKLVATTIAALVLSSTTLATRDMRTTISGNQRQEDKHSPRYLVTFERIEFENKVGAAASKISKMEEPGSTTPQAARRSQRSATVTISAPTDGSVFYGAYSQKLIGSALYGDGSAVPAERLRWSDTIGGKTTVICTANACTATFTVGQHKLTLEALGSSDAVMGSKSVTVTFYDSIH